MRKQWRSKSEAITKATVKSKKDGNEPQEDESEGMIDDKDDE